ncbi:MAG: hypothetical protein FWE69_02025 [Clostridiales bacterium]|nr:hypothetical protein [Clostridiales bacterium]
MGGFKKESNNTVFEQNFFSSIVLHISQCCLKMRDDCRTAGESLYNHEDKISRRLVERYLNRDIMGLRFILQNPEHYNTDTDTHKGRTDIKVVSLEWLFMNSDAYYIIECKRLDGKPRLNKEYVCEGISRFVIMPSPKYSSYYGRNIMLGYIVVQSVNIDENTKNIDNLQRNLLADVTIGKMQLVDDDRKGFSRYQCSYQSNDNHNIELTHLFCDFSDVVCADK